MAVRVRGSPGIGLRPGADGAAGGGPDRDDGAAPPEIRGIGGAPPYLINRFADGQSIYDINFSFPAGVPQQPPGRGLRRTG